MGIIQRIPKDLEEALGAKGTDGLIELLNSSFISEKGDTLQIVEDKFEKRLMTESFGINIRITEETLKLDKRITEETLKLDKRITEETLKLEKRITEETSKLDKRITEETSKLDKRITEETSRIRVQISDFRAEAKSDVSELHKAISSQTKWLLVLGLSLTTIYPLINKLLSRLIP